MLRIIAHRYEAPAPATPMVVLEAFVDAQGNVMASVALDQNLHAYTPIADAMPAAEAFLHAISYAEHHGIGVLWVHDPRGDFPPEKRPTRDCA